MDAELLAVLLNKASRLGAQQIEVIGWKPPASGSSDLEGNFIIRQHSAPIRGSDRNWWNSKR